MSKLKGKVAVVTGSSKGIGAGIAKALAADNPGMIETEGTHTGGMIGSDFEKRLISQAPLGRTGQVTDINPIAVFLASDDSGWLTGEQLLATGGIR